MSAIFVVIVLAAFCLKSRSSLPKTGTSNLLTVCLLVCICYALQSITVGHADYMKLGWNSSCAVLASSSQDNAVKCFGDNRYGQLGQGDTNNRGDEPYEMGKNLHAIDFGTAFRVRFLSRSLGQHRCVISDANDTKCFGRNHNGQLGYGDTTNRGDTNNSMGDFLLPVDLGDGFVPMKIGCGGRHTCALSTVHHVKCWGFAGYGSLGYPYTEWQGDNTGEMGNNLSTVDLGNNFVPMDIIVMWYHNCVVSAEGKTKCWGYNHRGQLGYGDTNHRGDEVKEMGNNLTEVDLGTGFIVVQICGGAVHTCALSAAGAVKCFGQNHWGQLGLEIANTSEKIGDEPGEMGDNLTAIDFGPGFVVMALSCGIGHNCALSTNHSIKCWGRNFHGQLGYGDTVERGAANNTMGRFLPEVDLGSDFIPKQVECGLHHTCSTSHDNETKCWGLSDSGQTGHEDTMPRGDLPNQMADNLPLIDLLDYTIAPTTDPTALPSASPSQQPTPSPTYCTAAKYLSWMNCADHLWPDESLVSENCLFRLEMQNNGDLVLQRRWSTADEFSETWDSNTSIANYSGESVPRMEIKSDGRLVVTEYSYKWAMNVGQMQLWQNDNAPSNVATNCIKLYLSDTGCLQLLDNTMFADILALTLWYVCPDYSELVTEDTTTASATISDDSGDGNVNEIQEESSSTDNNTWWSWLLTALIVLCCMAVFIFWRRVKRESDTQWTQPPIVPSQAGEHDSHAGSGDSDRDEDDEDGDGDVAMKQIRDWAQETELVAITSQGQGGRTRVLDAVMDENVKVLHEGMQSAELVGYDEVHET